MSEPPVDNLLTVAQAIAVIDAVSARPRPEQEVSIGENAGSYLGGVLAADIVADRDYPPFDKSLMDGYAVRCADAIVGERLKVVGEVAAGRLTQHILKAGEAIAIMTGAPIPPGSDGVVPVEDVTVSGDQIVLSTPASPGRYIARAGSDCRRGEVVLKLGTRCGPTQAAVIATVGARPKYFDRPRVAVLTTGNEIVPHGATPRGTHSRDASGPMLSALLNGLGCFVYPKGPIEDDPEFLRAAIEKAFTDHDVVFITGGMSMGKYDYVPRILREIGCELHVTKLRIKPGKPFVFGSRKGKYVFGLPGNPVSAFVCTLRLASRLIARLCGEVVAERWIDAELESPLPANGPREFYQPAILVRTGNRTVARPLQWRGSADVFTLAKADALLVRPENDPQRPAGSRVQLLEVPR